MSVVPVIELSQEVNRLTVSPNDTMKCFIFPSNKKGKKNKKNFSRTYLIIFIIMLVITLSISLTIISQNMIKTYTFQYGCLIDAASSSSRVGVFKWIKRSKKSLPSLVQITQSEKYKPALDHITTDNELNNQINEMLNYCENKINFFSSNKTNINKSPIYLMATAGMRSLSKEEQTTKLNFVKSTIKKSNFHFYNDDFARVITGKEEGIYGWITANYLNKIFSTNNKWLRKKNTFGSLDLGGGSVEITFVPEIKGYQINNEDFANIKIGKRNYNVYSHSFENYGQDEMFDKSFKYLIKQNEKENNNNVTIEHPCLLNGYFENYTDKEYSKDYVFVGNNNIEKCQEIIKNLIEKKDCSSNFCSIQGNPQPKINKNQKFYAISVFAFSGTFFGLDEINFHSPKEFFELAKVYCGKNWKDVIETNKEMDKSYLRLYCFTGNYIYNLLVNGFGFGENWKNIIFSSKVNGVEVSWALGAMVYETFNLS